MKIVNKLDPRRWWHTTSEMMVFGDTFCNYELQNVVLVRECPSLTKRLLPCAVSGKGDTQPKPQGKTVEQTKGVVIGQACFWQTAGIAQGRGLSGLEAAAVPALKGRTVSQ